VYIRGYKKVLFEDASRAAEFSVHYEYYDDHNVVNHPEDWKYDKESRVLLLMNKKQIHEFKIGTNVVDKEKCSGYIPTDVLESKP